MGFSDVQQVPGVVNCGSCMARYPLVSLEASKKKNLERTESCGCRAETSKLWHEVTKKYNECWIKNVLDQDPQVFQKETQSFDQFDTPKSLPTPQVAEPANIEAWSLAWLVAWPSETWLIGTGIQGKRMNLKTWKIALRFSACKYVCFSEGRASATFLLLPHSAHESASMTGVVNPSRLLVATQDW